MADSTLDKIKQFSDDQYSNENRLNARIQIYDFCEKKINWHEWAFDHLDFKNVARVLELGCGGGQLWTRNIHKIPEDIQVTLTDISKGMVDSVREELTQNNHRFEFRVTDACKTPFNSNHFQELFDIAIGFDKSLVFDTTLTVHSFNLENGEDVLSSYFKVVNKYVYQNDVIMKNTEPLILYLASCCSPEQLDTLKNSIDDFRSYLESVINETGEVRITNKTVLFKFRKK